jgi:hypothetical protein
VIVINDVAVKLPIVGTGIVVIFVNDVVVKLPMVGNIIEVGG